MTDINSPAHYDLIKLNRYFDKLVEYYDDRFIGRIVYEDMKDSLIKPKIPDFTLTGLSLRAMIWEANRIDGAIDDTISVIERHLKTNDIVKKEFYIMCRIKGRFDDELERVEHRKGYNTIAKLQTRFVQYYKALIRFTMIVEEQLNV